MGICFQMDCKLSYVPLNAEYCMQNVKKNQNFIFGVSSVQMERNAYIIQILVNCSVKDLFLARVYESTESCCYHFASASALALKVLRQSFSTTTSQKHLILETLARNI